VATWTVLTAGALFVLGVLALRYLLLPNVDVFRAPIVQAISSAVGRPVQIARLEGSWRGFRPELSLHGLRMLDVDGQSALQLERADAVLSWLSLLSGKLRFSSIEFVGVSVDVRRDPAGMLWIAGRPLRPQQPGQNGSFGDWVLAQRQIVVRRASISWTDEVRAAPTLVIADVSFRLDNDGTTHRFGLEGAPPTELAAPVSLRGELSGRRLAQPEGWAGRVYGEVAYANLVQLQSWVPLPVHLDSGAGSLKLWFNVADGQVQGATLDATLVNVSARLAPDTAPLAMRDVAGRIQWAAQPAGMRVAGQGITFTTSDGVVLPAVNIDYLLVGDRTELSFSGLELAPVVQLAERLPLDAVVRERLKATSPSGRVSEAQLSWQGQWDLSRPYSVQAKVERLQWHPDGALPGVRGISAQVHASERGGSASLRASEGALEIPRVFNDAIPLDFLSAEVDWQPRGGQTQVVVRSAAFTNEHAAGNVSGSYLTAKAGPGSVDISGQLVRADTRAVWRYIPRTAPVTQRWLRRALLQGTASDVHLKLKGPLERFPFRNGEHGQFEVTAKVNDVTLSYAESWPAAEGLNGTIAFRGDSMAIESSGGRTLGVQIASVNANLAGLGKGNERLLLQARASGPLGDFLRYVSASPVNRYTGRVTEKMRGEGEGDLALKLDVPLQHTRDTKVDGTFAIKAREFIVDSRVPRLTDVAATVTFSDDDVTVPDGKAKIYGSPLRFSLARAGDGTIQVEMEGRMEAAALRQAAESPLAEAFEGSADWKGRLALRKRGGELTVESQLVGMALNLPPPFAKEAASPLPLRVVFKDWPDRDDELSATVGRIATAVLTMEGAGIKGGEIRFRGQARPQSRPGLVLAGQLDTIDLDAWRRVLARSSALSPSQSAGGVALAAVNVNLGSVLVAGRRFTDLRISGDNGPRGWEVELESEDIAGSLRWRGGQADRLTGQFHKLILPPPEKVQVGTGKQPEKLPAVDLVVDDFIFEGMHLGRLELAAVPQSESWQLERLIVTNADGRLYVSGKWLLGEVSRTELAVRFEAGNIGNMLKRLGYGEGIVGGTGTLSGPVTWQGELYRPDLATLEGQLQLEANKGRFAKIDPGVGKLLGILSLQALPRRLSLDFRDIFSSGFTFERITADAVINRGIARTENFHMSGPAARISMRGQVDLLKETQDLHLHIQPQLSTGVAIAGAVINPAIGVATLLAQKALGDPVEQAAALEYHVTGTWAEPRVERLNVRVEAPPSRR
jgi:uncharacterized protein (TIGR02099 family)